MKPKKYIYNAALGIVAAASLTTVTGCSEDFLDPDPLSMFAPENTYNTESGLQSTLAMCDRHLRLYYTHYDGGKCNISVPIMTEYLFSELGLYGKTDAGGGLWDDIAYKLSPTSGMQDGDSNRMQFYWDEGYNGIKYANSIINYIDGVEGLDEKTRNEYKGRAYFHRAFRYYILCWQWGDVPLVTKLLDVPKQNYSTTSRDQILRMCTEEVEKAVQWVPSQSEMEYYGMVNKEACRHLLAKLYLSIGEWKKAEAQCDTLINYSGLALMTAPFGDASAANSLEPQTWNVTRNVIWDLHRPENKMVPANTETIMGLPNCTEQSRIDFLLMRIFGPMWNDTRLTTPDGMQAVLNLARSDGRYDQTLDALRAFGRGIGTMRPTYFAQHALWNVNGVEDNQDYRHNSQVGNWVHMEDIKYNNPSSAYHGQNLRLYKDDGSILCTDTIRDWFDFPLYKIYLKDASAENIAGSTQFNGCTNGSNGNWYLFRLAETYLMRAEARLYQGNTAGATEDVNTIRNRAHCSQLYSTVNIGDIVNERARELFLEEFRKVELTRISYDLALSGVPDEWGNVYDVNTWDKQEGTDKNNGSYWYQRIVHYSLYNNVGDGISSGVATLKYTMDKCNVFWPIPNSAITANNKGQLWQNYGYDGYDPSIKKWEDWHEAVADENRVN